ncbi:related to ureidoglycolate hydrolase [Rhynchosporium graminicola]|uniref:Related to ureidoglycolate hydrolase n=1 Tax=Rhynchosporium graminicola TaxID=2792576 RepID=A0A1E1K4Q8_9HELO|nr:related to ureidoglycolate hydrolase [Rhynchosporium commune]
MPLAIPGPSQNIYLQPSPLTQTTFSKFGTVIANLAPLLNPSSSLTSKDIPPNAVVANQGSALKFLDVSLMADLYAQAPSEMPSKAVINLFVCAPRTLTPSSKAGEEVFPVEILERHPYTSQTFIPLGVSPDEAKDVKYLVIVAPSLPPSSLDEGFSVPEIGTGREGERNRLPGRGLPDLKNLKAFVAHGGMAVTYGAGTWHAPMVVLGRKPIDFVVVQSVNGVGEEDCQEVVFGGKIGVTVEMGKKISSKL